MNENLIVNNLSRNRFCTNEQWKCQVERSLLSCTVGQFFTRFYFMNVVLSFETSGSVDTDLNNELFFLSFTLFSEFE